MQYSKGAENEMNIDRDIIVLATPEMENLPAWVIALIVAGGLAAALSTSAGLLLVISTSVSHDLLKKNLMPNISDKKELVFARLASAVGIVIAGYFGINPPRFVATVVAIAFGLAGSSLFPAITMSIFSRKMNQAGAIAGIAAGLLFTTVYIIYFKFLNPEANIAANWLFGISPEEIGMLGMVVNFAVAIVACRMTATTPQHVVEMVESIHLPKVAGGA